MTEKTENLLAKIKRHVESRKYRISNHAIARQNQRDITLKDALYVLKSGMHEEAKTTFDVKHQTWKYAIRGKTLDRTELRVIIAFVDEMVIITVMKIIGSKK